MRELKILFDSNTHKWLITEKGVNSHAEILDFEKPLKVSFVKNPSNNGGYALVELAL